MIKPIKESATTWKMGKPFKDYSEFGKLDLLTKSCDQPMVFFNSDILFKNFLTPMLYPE